MWIFSYIYLSKIWIFFLCHSKLIYSEIPPKMSLFDMQPNHSELKVDGHQLKVYFLTVQFLEKSFGRPFSGNLKKRPATKEPISRESLEPFIRKTSIFRSSNIRPYTFRPFTFELLIFKNFQLAYHQNVTVI